MEELQVSRHGRRPRKAAAKTDYDDVFGGPPRFAAPFAGVPEDYSEIFGGVTASCSIPFLDLPPASDGLAAAAAAAGLDYREIFAGSSFGDFAVPYEELFGEPASEESPPSQNGRNSSKEKSNLNNIESSALHEEYANEDPLPYLEEDQLSDTSLTSDEVVKQVKLSYNKTSRGRMEDPLVQTTCISHPCTGFTFMVDSCDPLQNTPADNASETVSSGRIQGERRKAHLPGSSSASPKSARSDFATADQEQHNTICLSLVNGHADINQSTSSEDAVSPISFLSVSDISLQTRPLQGPPPSRPPPKLQNKQELSTARKVVDLAKDVAEPAKYNTAFPKSLAHQDVVIAGSPFLFDVEIDASSAAAASAAAMKEAMELAQARLKSARELLERKNKGIQNRKKQGHGEIKKSMEIEGTQAIEEESFKEVLSQKKTVKDENIDGLSIQENYKFTFSGKLASHYDKERGAQSADGFESSQASLKLKRSGEWKLDDEFYELINNKQEYRNTAGAADQEDIAKRTKTTRKHTIVEEAENPTTGLSAEVEKKEKLDNNDRKELEVKYLDLKEVNMTTTKDKIEDVTLTPIVLEGPLHEENIIKQEVWASEGEEDVLLKNLQESHCDGKMVNELYASQKAPNSLMKEMHNIMPMTCANEQNVNEIDENNYNHCDENSVSEATQETSNATDGLNILHENEKSFAAEGSEKVLEAQETCKFDEIHGSQGGKCDVDVAEKASDGESNEEELSTANFACEPCESEKAPLSENENVNVVTVHGESSLAELGENLERTEAADRIEDLKASGIQENVECPQEENVVKLESSSLGDEHGKVEELNLSEDASKLTESESKVQLTPNSDEEDGDKQQRAQGLEESVEPHNVTMAVSEDSNKWNYNARKEKDSQPEYAQNGKQGDNTDSVKQDSCDKPTEGNVTLGFRGDDMRTNADTNSCRIGVNTDLNLRQAAGLEKSARLPSSAKDNVSVSTEGMRKDADIIFCRMGSNTDTKDQQANCLEKSGSVTSLAKDSASAVTETSEKATSNIQKEERRSGRKIEKEGEQEKERSRRIEEEEQWEREREQEERTRILEEEKEREREREKDRLAVERATREAHERAFAEARERAERIAMERITAARQRALAEPREKEEKSYAETYERQTSEKISREVRLRAERAAVERATAEARERAIERAKAEKAAADAKERMDRLRSSFKENSKEFTHDAQFQRTSDGSQSYADLGKEGGGESALRHKARLERHQRTAERAAKALAEKNMRDMMAQREQVERNRLAEYLDAEVKRWSNGKEGNLRALLSTLQYILGPESGWQPVPLTEVIMAASVKKAYRKATLCVHPDKLQQRGASIQHKYICEKVFDLLKEAWNRYNSEER